MSLLFIFGAGASYGSGPCTPYNPPLGKDFFPDFKKHFASVNIISEDLEKAFSEDFEKGMDIYYEQHKKHMRRFLCEMAIYFSKFKPQKNNLYITLLKILLKKKRTYTLSTTNYDLLLELAALNFSKNIFYGAEIKSKDTIDILKIHGSCNFLPDVGDSIRMIAEDEDKVTITYNDGPSVFQGPIKATANIQEIENFLHEQSILGPAIAMYAPSKRILFFSDYVQRQLDIWKKEVGFSSKIFIIGLKLHPTDFHIWETLAATKSNIYYAGFEFESVKNWFKQKNKFNIYKLADTFEDAIKSIIKRNLI